MTTTFILALLLSVAIFAAVLFWCLLAMERNADHAYRQFRREIDAQGRKIQARLAENRAANLQDDPQRN